MKNIKLIPKYIWQYKGVIICFFLFAIIFAIVSYLYRLNLQAVLYATLLCAVAGLIFLGVHFYRYCKKHNERLRLLEYSLTLPLPSPENIAEADFLTVIEKLRKQYYADGEIKSCERAEYMDYYTMWMHQIKTPIAAIKLMLQSEDTEKNRALAGELFRIEQYVEMALWYLRTDDTADTVFKNYRLDDIIKPAVRKYASTFVSKKIKLIYTPVDAEIITDKKWLSFIIEQLLANAVKYTESGSVTISVQDKILCISDTGIGISEQDIPRIFEKGYTGYNGRLERQSTGIGLYLCRRAADKLSHKLAVSSEIGKGSSFFIDLNSYELKAE